MIFLDTETVGFVGPAVLIQWAEGPGPITLHEIWNTPVKDTLALIERIVEDEVCAFNLVFDWFQLTKIYNLLLQASNKDRIPLIVELMDKEREAIDKALCLKPKAALDLMLHARRGPYQNLMDRNNIYIRRIPVQLAAPLCSVLDRTFSFPKIFFAKRVKGQKWEVDPESADPDFPDIVLRFGASSGLKALALDAGIAEETIEYPIPEGMRPDEKEYRPWGGNWSQKIYTHIAYWSKNPRAREYATNDIVYLRALYKHFGCPAAGDTDSELCCAVATARYAGFDVDLSAARRELDKFTTTMNSAPRAPNAVYAYLSQVMSATQRLALTSTDKDVLNSLEKWEDKAVSERATKVKEARKAEKRVQLLDKLIETERFHPDFNVIGARSSRMSGASDTSSQGIPKGIRHVFTLGHILSGGDFDSFEDTIADAVYGDPVFREDLGKGIKLHVLLGSALYHLPFEQIVGDKYQKAKNTKYAWLYGAQEDKMAKTAGISLEEAGEAYGRLTTKYKRVGEARTRVFDKFCSMRQPGGIGTKVEWHEPADYIETLFGFKRYFTLENTICRTLFELSTSLPKDLDIKGIRVKRRDRYQTPSGAIRSALYGAAFNIQAKNMRAAANHEIQGTGAHVTKELQAALWCLQPVGIHPFQIKTINEHDEIECVHSYSSVEDIVYGKIEEFRNVIPLIGIGWKTGMESWADK